MKAKFIFPLSPCNAVHRPPLFRFMNESERPWDYWFYTDFPNKFLLIGAVKCSGEVEKFMNEWGWWRQRMGKYGELRREEQAGRHILFFLFLFLFHHHHHNHGCYYLQMGVKNWCHLLRSFSFSFFYFFCFNFWIEFRSACTRHQLENEFENDS